MHHVKGPTVLLASFLFMGGCASNYPLPIDEYVPTCESSSSWGVLKTNLKGYRDHYKEVHTRLLRHQYRASDGTILGGIVGVVGGLASSTTAAVTGAGIASGSTMYGQRYAFNLQADNYRRAANAMHCMLREASARRVDDSYAIAAARKIDEVRHLLYMAQSSVALVEVDPKQIADAYKLANDTRAGFVDGAVQADLAVAVLAQMEICVTSF